MKKLILLAIFIFPVWVNAQRAYTFTGWTSDVWPSTNHYRLQPTNYYEVQGVSYVEIVDVWSVDSATNFNPVHITDLDWSAFNAGLEYLQNPFGPDTTTNNLVFTNTYWRGIRYNNTYDLSGITTTQIFINTQFFGFADVTMRIDRVSTAVNDTNFLCDVMDMWSLEAGYALNERLSIAGETNYHFDVSRNHYNVTALSRGQVSFNNRDNLVNIKTAINSIMSDFADTNHAVSGSYDSYFESNRKYTFADTTGDSTNDTWVPYNSQGVPQRIPRVSVTTLCVNISGFPCIATTNVLTNNVNGWFAGNLSVQTVTNHVYTNVDYTTKWFAYTPSRDLGGNGIGQAATVNGYWPFQTDPNAYTGTINSIPGSYTNDLITSCEGIYTQIIAITSTTNLSIVVQNETGSQIYSNLFDPNFYLTGSVLTNISFTCTNTSMDVGFNTKDYGFQFIPAVMDQLRWTYRDVQATQASNETWTVGWASVAVTNRKFGEANSGLGSTGTWDYVKGLAEADYTNLLKATYVEANNQGSQNSTSNKFAASLDRAYNYMATTNLSTNLNKDVDWYVISQRVPGPTHNFYLDDFGDFPGITLSASNFFRIQTSADVGVSALTATSSVLGSTSNPIPTNTWVGEPSYPVDEWKGYLFSVSPIKVIKYDTQTNGIIFKNAL